jgi:hypothetical protein
MRFDTWLRRREDQFKATAVKVFPGLTALQIETAWREMEMYFRRTAPHANREMIVSMCFGACLAKRFEMR